MRIFEVRRVARTLMIVVAAWLGIAAAASAQAAPPVCPAGDQEVAARTPGYGQIGASGSYYLDSDYPEDIAPVLVTVISSDGTKYMPLTLEGETTKLVLASPSQGSSFTIVIDWVQDPGSPAACRGQLRFEKVPLLPAPLKPGDPFKARFSGAYRVVLTPKNYKASTDVNSWTLTPMCDVFACPARVRSSGGLRGVFRPRADGSYVLSSSESKPSDECIVTTTRTDTTTGAVLSRRTTTIKHAYRYSFRYFLRVTSSQSGPAHTRGNVLNFSGTLTTRAVPTAAARALHCTKTRTFYDHVTGRRR